MFHKQTRGARAPLVIFWLFSIAGLFGVDEAIGRTKRCGIGARIGLPQCELISSLENNVFLFGCLIVSQIDGYAPSRCRSCARQCVGQRRLVSRDLLYGVGAYFCCAIDRYFVGTI